jgi:hypothetical protein
LFRVNVCQLFSKRQAKAALGRFDDASERIELDGVFLIFALSLDAKTFR